MEIQEIKDEDYSIQYDPKTTTVRFQGELSLGGPEDYAPITKLLNDLIEQEPPTITLNLRELEFLNSAGISMLSKFVIGVRKKQTIAVVVQGSEEIPWQSKSLKNLQRLLTNLRLELE